jgi:hypothetical protein
MTQNTAFIIHLDVRKIGALHYVTSSNFLGLHVCGTDVDSTFQSLVKVVKALFKHNWGFDVEVFPATTNGKSFPKSLDICDQLVVRKAA